MESDLGEEIRKIKTKLDEAIGGSLTGFGRVDSGDISRMEIQMNKRLLTIEEELNERATK
jgi:hypothetical protein